ncbi:glycosyltransferase family 4 protein [Mycobacteroides salmoniphilum]|uniref:glycosyltransferase family 4 protein n=1 Tax=Mycobacteroides salmoniphilum TaxID=404941 RepID=UPI000993051F|nr:glycosyltransferase family 4 protein [Mycobacteroides salmoniphilum]QCH24064.1 Putative glycosyltransferase EpsD [Mycobacteroides salmoniphilum]
MQRRLHAYVALPHGVSASQWEVRNGADEVPDRAPYGLHRLANYGVTPTFSEFSFGRRLERVAGHIRYRTGDLEILEVIADRAARRASDVVFCYDERTGVPAAAAASIRMSPPVVTGVGWLTEPADFPPVHRGLARHALARSAAVFSQSPPQVELLSRSWGVDDSRLHFAPVGIDTDFYRAQPWESTATPLVVSAGEDVHRDHALLVQGVLTARERCPGLTLELATALPVSAPPGVVTLHTERLYGRMRDLYRRSTVVAIAVRPDVITGSGLTVALEAMASGRPVIMTDNPGIAHYVRHNVDGILVPPGDPDAFARAIADLVCDPDRARALGQAGAQRVRAEFSSERMAEHFASIMHGV